MSAPEYVPSPPSSAPRPAEFGRMPPPRPYVERPDEQATIPRRPTFGTPGPDAGYALHLARTLEGELELAAGERVSDASAAGCALAMKRAARFGRAPIKADVRIGLTMLGYLGGSPTELRMWRTHALRGIATDYHLQRHLVDSATLARTAEAALAGLAAWRDMLGVDPADGFVA
jgi:hypothetical protein